MLTAEYFERVRDEERAEHVTQMREDAALWFVAILFIIGAIVAG